MRARSTSCATSGCGQELVQRRVEQADRHRQAVHRLEQALEVAPAGAAAARRARSRRSSSSSARIIADASSRGGPSPKNMCSVRQRPMPSAPNSRALLASSGVSAFVRTPRRAELVGPAQHGLECVVDLGLDERHVVGRDRPRRAVDRDAVALARARVSPIAHASPRRGRLELAGAGDARARPSRARPAPRARPCRPRWSGCPAPRGSRRRRRPR